MLQQFELYHKEREMDDIKREVLRQKDAVKQLETERKTAETSLKAAKARVAEKTTQLTTLDQQIRDAVCKMTVVTFLVWSYFDLLLSFRRLQLLKLSQNISPQKLKSPILSQRNPQKSKSLIYHTPLICV